MATLYLEIVRELKRDMFTQLHLSCFFFIIWLIALGKDMRQQFLISFFWSKMSNFMLVLCTNTLSITNNTIVGIYINK